VPHCLEPPVPLSPEKPPIVSGKELSRSADFGCALHHSLTFLNRVTLLDPIFGNITEALKQKGKLRLYYQIDPDFAGIEPGAVWDD
jgi:hypothetical protein